MYIEINFISIRKNNRIKLTKIRHNLGTALYLKYYKYFFFFLSKFSKT